MRMQHYYLTAVVLFTAFSYLFVDPNFFYLKDVYTNFYANERILSALGFTFFIVVFFYIYVLLLKNKVTSNLVKRYVIFSLPLLLSYPAVLSFDIFNYILTAKLTFYYLENPYYVMPIEIIGEPMLKFTHAANKFALYGPFWIILTSVPHYLGLGIFLLTALLFKLTVALFYFLTAKIIYLFTKSSKSVLFFALNPLVLIETFVSGHNDVVMMGLALLAFYLVTKKRIFLAFCTLAASILVKYATIFLLPLFLVMVYKTVRGREIKFETIGKWGFFSMLVPFLLSPIREELYPWYVIWLVSFAALTYKKKAVLYFIVAISIGVLLRYVPFMIIGEYTVLTQYLKSGATLTFLTLAFVFYTLNTRWSKE